VATDAAEGLYRVVDAAYEKRSVAISSNLHPAGFDELMPKTLATATVDRLLHHAHVCQTSGDSVRLTQALAGKGVTRPDVYLHGAAGSWTTFLPRLFGTLANDPALIDLPSWGKSTKGVRLEHLRIEAMAESVTDVWSALGYRRWNLVGHSMGGFLA